MSSETPKAPIPHPPSTKRLRSRPRITDKPSKPKGSSKLFYSIAGIASLFVVGGLLYVGYELTKPTKKPSKKKSGTIGKGKVIETKGVRPKGDYYEIVVKREAGQAIGIMLCPGENKVPGAFVAACKANIDLGLKIGSQLVEVNGKWLDSDMNFKETLQLLAKSCSPEGKLCFRENGELNVKWTTADIKKTEGNELYKKKQIDASISKYSDAIKLHPTNKVYYSNKVLALLSKAEHSLGDTSPIYNEALSDCRAMRELDVFENYQKGHHVRGVVLLRMGKFKHARTAFQTVLRIDSKNKKALARLKDCQNAIVAAAAEAELKKKESSKECELVVSEEKQQASAPDEKAVAADENTSKTEQPEEPKGNEVPASPSKGNGPDSEGKDTSNAKKPASTTLTQMVEDLKEEVSDKVNIPDKPKNDESSLAVETKVPEKATKDVQTKKESAATTLTQLVEDLKEEVNQKQQETNLQKPEQKSAEGTLTETTIKPEGAKEEIPENEDKVGQSSTTFEEPNSNTTVAEKMLADPSEKIVEDMVKTTVERAVGQVIESGGEIMTTSKNEQSLTEAAAAIIGQSTENSAAATDTTAKQPTLVAGDVYNNTLVQN